MRRGQRNQSGGLPRALGRLGGIDFSSLELRYVSDKGSKLGYAFRAPSSATPGDPATGLETARQSSDAFFTWLALPPQSFWVNLNPSQPDRIIDPQLARTDVGRVLLDADMALKRSAVNLTRPTRRSATSTGTSWSGSTAIARSSPAGRRACGSCPSRRACATRATSCTSSTRR